MTTATVSDPNPTANPIPSDLTALAAQIATETAAVYSSPDDVDITHAWERVWRLRALVAVTPARSLVELQTKASVIDAELRRDGTAFDSDAPGSVPDLVESLIRDLLALRLDA
jgi:hypothetical protein